MEASRDLLKVGDIPVKHVLVNDTSLAFIEKGNGKPVVFVHGAISDLRIWLEQVESFSHHYRAISYSRGTHWPAEQVKVDRPYTLSLHTRELIGFLGALNLKKVHLVGHSFGGAIALHTALEHPELVESLVLAEPGPILALFGVSEVDLIAKQKIGFDEALLLAQRWSAEAAIRQFLKVIVGADVLDQLRPLTRSVALDNAPTLAPMLEHYFVSPPVKSEQLGKVKAPTLLISGEFSPKIGLLTNERLHNVLPNSEEVILYSVSHGLHIENPAAFSQVVLDFLANH